MSRPLFISLALALMVGGASSGAQANDVGVAEAAINCSLCHTTTRWLCEQAERQPVWMMGTLRDVRQIDHRCLADPVDPNFCQIEWNVRISEVVDATTIRGTVTPTEAGVIFAHVREQRGMEPVVTVPDSGRVLLVGKVASSYRLFPREIGHTMSVEFVCPAGALRSQ